MDLAFLVTQALNALQAGMLLFLLSSGLALIFGVLHVINFAHGAIGMLGAFAYWQIHDEWGWPTPISLAVVLLVQSVLFALAGSLVGLFLATRMAAGIRSAPIFCSASASTSRVISGWSRRLPCFTTWRKLAITEAAARWSGAITW